MIYLASDHGGYAVIEKVKGLLEQHQLEFKDLGPKQLKTDDDYPDYIFPLAEKVATSHSLGIMSCRNGEGAAIAANKVHGIRAAVCWNMETARTCRNDDNANILSLPADYLTDLEIEKIVTTWLTTPFSHDARHLRRLEKIRNYEQQSKRG